MKYYLILTSFFCAFTSLFAANISVKKAQKAPTLDGIISAGEWERIEREFTTVPSLDKPERLTELYMLYDDDNIYVALKHDEEVESEDDAVFSLSRFEMRFGEGKKIDYFVATLDGKKVPAQGWDVVWGDKVIECRIPLEILTGFRIYTGNITRTGHRLKSGESSSLFPIQKQNFVDPSFHGRFLLGTEEEISAAKETLGGNRQTRLAEAEKMAALLQAKEQHLLGEKASSYSVTKHWQPYKFYTGKDFHFMFRPKYEKNSRFFVPGFAESLPIFRDAAYQVHAWYLNRGFREKLQPIKKLLEDSENGSAGYILKKTDNPIMFGMDGGYNTFEHEIQCSPETLQEFVSKYGHRLLCVDNNEAVGPNGGFPMIMGLAGLSPKNKKEAYEAFRSVSFDKRRTFVRNWAVFYPELAPWRAPVSATYTDHAFLSFGFCMGGMECGPKTLNLPFSHSVTRGAARQYGKPFRIFLTTHDDMIVFPGWEKAHRHYTFNDYRRALRPQTRNHKHSGAGTDRESFSMEGPQYGVPHEDWRRCYIYAYMAGANIFFDECGHYIMYALYDYKTIDKEDPLAVNLREKKSYLSKMGEMMANFYDNIVCREDRGVVYSPIAIMWDLHHGFFANYHQQPWGMFPSTEGDLMMHAVKKTLFPRSERVYNNRGFRTSEFGDVFDVITNDASEQIIKSYPVVFFCGDVPIDSAFAEKLVAYVAEGGTLVINWKQIEDYHQLFPDDFLGASVEPERRKAISSYSNLSGKVLHERIDFSYNAVTLLAKSEAAIFTADSRRDPLVVVSPYGKGKVVLSMPDFLKERYSSGTMLNIFSDLLLHLSRSSLPLSVEGDVQFQVNRNSRGWVVALYNNYGMAAGRDWQNPMPAPDPKEDVMVTIKPKQQFSSAREWFTCTQGLTLNVPAGEVRIVEIID